MLRRFIAAFKSGLRKGADDVSGYLQLFRMLHWIVALCIIGLFITGLSLHAVAQSLFPSLGWSIFSSKLPVWLLPGRVHSYHLFLATIFLPSIITMLWAYCSYEQLRKPAYIVIFGGALVMIVTGLIMLHPSGPSIIHMSARGVHTIFGLIVLPAMLIYHAVLGLRYGWNNLSQMFAVWRHIKLRLLLVYALLIAFSYCLIMNGIPCSRPWNRLTATLLPEVIDSDVDLWELPWDEAEPLTLRLAGGASFNNGRTDVSLKALHDGRELFLLAEWDDPEKDSQCTPWKRTEDGWERQITDANDENVYFEDQFALAFPVHPDRQFQRLGCTYCCHIDSDRVYGSKFPDSMIDVWHWKAARTDPVGQADDKYWTTADLSAEDVRQHGDPNDGGGYSDNVALGGRFPIFLPDGPAAVVDGAILEPLARKYTLTAAEKIKPGDMVPGIIASVAEGDRGHISCQSRYEGGRWQLYMRRKLDTGSPYDIAFSLGKSHSFGCAAFDRSENRHAYNFSVYELLLEEEGTKK